MNAQRSWWKRPSGVTVAAVVILINVAADWWVFKPQNLGLFIAVEALVMGGIVWLAVAFPNRPA